ncbi:hypothetical protein [Burkholderia ubonensis]|uniref:hypothetical protein n=1 Tax=Burkholderia ubonensis TaxID=101571 RepID=UPI00075331B3|nr:hypothetical protein [Burkholderia ubonensis]KWN70212.1 hypothetical protein WM23_00005 [Burkholderia ubonensis]
MPKYARKPGGKTRAQLRAAAAYKAVAEVFDDADEDVTVGDDYYSKDPKRGTDTDNFEASARWGAFLAGQRRDAWSQVSFMPRRKDITGAFRDFTKTARGEGAHRNPWETGRGQAKDGEMAPSLPLFQPQNNTLATTISLWAHLKGSPGPKVHAGLNRAGTGSGAVGDANDNGQDGLNLFDSFRKGASGSPMQISLDRYLEKCRARVQAGAGQAPAPGGQSVPARDDPDLRRAQKVLMVQAQHDAPSWEAWLQQRAASAVVNGVSLAQSVIASLRTNATPLAAETDPRPSVLAAPADAPSSDGPNWAPPEEILAEPDETAQPGTAPVRSTEVADPAWTPMTSDAPEQSASSGAIRPSSSLNTLVNQVTGWVESWWQAGGVHQMESATSEADDAVPATQAPADGGASLASPATRPHSDLTTRGPGRVRRFLGMVQDIRIALRKQEQAEQARQAAERKEKDAFLDMLDFDPLRDPPSKFIDGYITALLKQSGVSLHYKDWTIYARWRDPKDLKHNPNLQISQASETWYNAFFTLSDIATGRYLKKVGETAPVWTWDQKGKGAGPLAKQWPVDFDWPPGFTQELIDKLLSRDMWDTFIDFVHRRLETGPMVDAAKQAIKMELLAAFATRYDSDSDESGSRLADFLARGRRVSYRGMPVAGLFYVPSKGQNEQGTLYSLANQFDPIPVKGRSHPIFSEGDAAQSAEVVDAIKNGIADRSRDKEGADLFAPQVYYTGKTTVAAPPKLDIGSADENLVDMVWAVFKDKLSADMDYQVLSRAEWYWELAAGWAKTSMQAATMMFGPMLGPKLTIAAGILQTTPDLVMSAVKDNPHEAKAHLNNFILGLVIEGVGIGLFLRHKRVIANRVKASVDKIVTKQANPNAEMNKVLRFANGLKERVLEKPVDMLVRLANRVTTTPTGKLARTIMQDGSPMNWIYRLEKRAGLLNKMQMRRLIRASRDGGRQAFLGTTPKRIMNAQELTDVPAGSRIAFVDEASGNVRDTMLKLEGGYAIGATNAYLGAGRFDGLTKRNLADTLRWTDDGCVLVQQGGQTLRLRVEVKVPTVRQDSPPIPVKPQVAATRYGGQVGTRVFKGRGNGTTTARP